MSDATEQAQRKFENLLANHGAERMLKALLLLSEIMIVPRPGYRHCGLCARELFGCPFVLGTPACAGAFEEKTTKEASQ